MELIIKKTIISNVISQEEVQYMINQGKTELEICNNKDADFFILGSIIFVDEDYIAHVDIYNSKGEKVKTILRSTESIIVLEYAVYNEIIIFLEEL
ncbi:MAG: hypothetical protein KAQ69_13120 [Spirochaetales bacterium]|nr:hypothetical protein [Spirochaetales bacterium]